MRTGEKRWLVTRGRSENRGIQVHRFPPGVIPFKGEPAADALRQRDIQRMVVRRTLIEPLSAATHVGVRARRRRGGQRALRYPDPLTDRGRAGTPGRAAAVAFRPVLTDAPGAPHR